MFIEFDKKNYFFSNKKNLLDHYFFSYENHLEKENILKKKIKYIRNNALKLRNINKGSELNKQEKNIFINYSLTS